MEHRALALAYRPQVFGDVAGQRHVTDVLAKAVEHDRIAHAYLFSGPRGTGKTTTARILAKVLNCPNRKGSVPCNKCDVCRDITSGVSLDVVEIDGASNRGIADIQQLRESVRFAATGGRWKVYIIDEVHQLSSDAFAALLKTLEEPPPHVVFIFATTDPLKLPDTIRSRTQRYEFARVPVRTIAERLQEIAKVETKAGRKLVLDDAAAFLIARKAEGGLRDAVSALDQIVSTGREKVDEAAVSEVLGLVSRETFFDLAEPVFGHDPAKALTQVHRAYRAGFDPKDLAEGLLEHFRNVLVLKVDPNAQELLAATPEECARYVKQGEGWSQGDLLRFLRITSDASVLMRDSSQPLLHFETAVLELANLEPGKTLAEILDRLNGVESGGGGPAGGAGGAGAGGGGSRGTSEVGSRSGAGTTRSSGPTRSAYASAAPESMPGVEMPAIPALEAVRPSLRPTAFRRPEGEGPPPAPADFDTPGLWGRVVSSLFDRKRILGHFVEEARVAGWQGDVLVLEIESGHRGLLEHKDNRTLILAAMREVYGRPLDYRCVSVPVTAATTGAVVATVATVATVPAMPVPSMAATPAASAVTESAPPDLEEPPPPDDSMVPPEEVSSVPAMLEASESSSATPAMPATPAPSALPGSSARRKHPDELSPGAQRTMLWLEGEIVGPPRGLNP
ncbi:MAG: DNA polymerase III subunit gamma/tau [Candidatus Eiseniibacteriota bacterium]